ncbi:hypothetical protein K456DRAFT_1824342 [Colletotrichum gloeosporioides 23]|nr:hypothetical protein K456DRAFT_1824342 [Colletotrichum gloeosporioides 23]
MLIPKADRKKIHEYLFREGVLVAKKDYNLPKHPDIDTKNLFVVKACQSLTSRGYVKTQFSWQYYYYTLTPEGLDYLREWLHLPAEIVPATHIKQQRSHAPPRGMLGEGERERRPFGGRGRGERAVVALAVAVALPPRTDMYSKKWMAGTVARLSTSQITGETSWEFGG